ncbi:uncharacterized protein LOC119386078 [Rhipicephalus sanguineus]|uniref:uncharacterized protein LOC119386078 n=1 Tax=Rhipicephalus sanguineus TaxID=34632 RepID=UPI001894CFBF|nr:uncharacterized protein LOC119386078 [Rhipicephalus sanguineus]
MDGADADVGAASKRPRSTSTAVHDKPAPSKDSESHGSVSSRRSYKSLQETKESDHAETRQIHAAHAKSSMASASSAAENMSVASSCSVRQEHRSNFSEALREVEMQPCEAGTGRRLEDSSENHTEKVQDWLQKCDSVPQKNTPSELERSEAQESSSGLAEKQLGSNRFFTSANHATSVSAKRSSVLDVSDTDPYKFIPSQKSLQAAQRGRRRRLRGNGRAAGLGTKRLSRRKSDRQKSVCEFENLRDLCAEEKAQEEDDARELEIELFVTPGVRPCVEKKVINQRRSHTTARRRPRKVKSNLQLKPLEEQAAEMQRKIAEAESHELIIAKALPGNVAGKRAEQIRNTNALKDVSNLKAQVDKVQNVAVSSLPMSPSEEENLPQQLSPEVDEPISCLAEKTSTVLHSKTCAEPVKGKDIVDLCSDEEGNMVEASEKCKDSAAEDTPGKVMPDERFVSNDTQENATLSSGPLADAPSSSGPKSTKQGDTAPEGQCQEDNQSEEQSSGRPLSLKDFEGFFKKSSRKTFDINASTQDLESLGSGAVDTLELMTDVCNSLKQVPASEPDLVPMYEEPVSAAMHTDHEANQQVSVRRAGDTLLPHKNSKVDQYASCSSDSMHKSKDQQQSPSGSTSSPASVVTPAVEPAVKDSSCDACHVTNTSAACPACNAHLSLVCADGVIKVILKGQPHRPVLVETGMCTEKPFTKVIICREAMIQTESSDSKEIDPGSSGDSCSSLPSPHLPPTVPDAVQVQTAMIENGSSGRVLDAAKYSHISNTSIYFNGSSANAACSGLEGEPVTHIHTKLAKPTVEDAVLKSTILDLDNVSRKSRSTEVLCENTEDQGVLLCRPNIFRASQLGLRTIVEDTEEMDTTPSMKSKEIDKFQSSPLQHEDSPAKYDWDEKGEMQSEVQCSAETSLLKSQNEAFLRREGTKLPDLGGKCSESSLSSSHAKRVLPQYKQSTGSSFQKDQMETCNNDADSRSGEAYFQSQKGTHHSMQKQHHDLNTVPNEDTCQRLAQAPASHSPGVTNRILPEAKCDQDLSSSVTPSFATANDESEVQKASLRHAHMHSPEKVAAIGGPGAVSPNQDDGHTSAESSPWSSPILIRRVAPRSVRNKARKALVSSDTTSREDNTDSCEIIDASSKASSGRKSSRQILPSVAVESDSDSDPVTESEAQELLRHAVQEDDSEEAALIFAKRAVAPLEACKKPRVPQLHASKRSVWSPGKRHSILQPSQQLGTSSQGKHHSLWKKHDSSVNDGDSSENTCGRSLATTVSSTLSEGLDRTLKEKMLEQDIADMKKQMLMLENELQKTTAGKGTTDNSHKDSSASNDVVAMNGKDDNWDWDDSDGADEVMDVVPPTPPRKSRSINDGSFCSTTK